MIRIKKEVVGEIIKAQGGNKDGASDAGEEKKYGITTDIAQANGYFGELSHLPYEIAFNIYTNKYWHSLRLDDICELSPNIARELADTGINIGVRQAAEFLQRSINAFNHDGECSIDLVVDGVVGDKTLSAFTDFLEDRGSEGKGILFNMLICLTAYRDRSISLLQVGSITNRYMIGSRIA